MADVAVVAEAGVRWAGRLASPVTSPLGEELRSLGTRLAIPRPRGGKPPLDVRGLPVLLVGGMGSTPQGLRPLEEWLTWLGARPAISPVAYGIDCGERTAAKVADALARHTDATGERCLVIAHSRGGQFARGVTVRHPDLVRGLVTMGSPINRLIGVQPLVRMQVVLLGLAGTLGVPGLVRAACLWGSCCRALRDDIAGPFPAHIPYLSLYSRDDRVVDWRSSLDPAARHREVATTHSGLLTASAAFDALADELRRLVPAQPVTRPNAA